jgi:hypothetical protein
MPVGRVGGGAKSAAIVVYNLVCLPLALVVAAMMLPFLGRLEAP